MKLRNKKTGEIIEDAQYRNYSTADGFGIRTPTDEYFYKSLKEFFKDWEDYTYRKPLIKDEKIRKAVRAWAEANRTKYVWVSTALKGIDITQDFGHLQLTEYKQSISFECEADFKSGTYTITELCGEEE